MLLTHLQCHTQSTTTKSIHRNTDDTTRHIALERLLCSHITSRRATKAHWTTQSLGSTYGNICAPLCWWCKECQRKQICIGGYKRTYGVSRSDKVGVVAHLAICGRILHNRTKLLTRKGVVGVVIDNQFNAKWLTAGEQYIECLRKYIFIYEEKVAPLLYRLARAKREHHSHSLGCGCTLVEQRAVGNLHTRKRDYCGLIIEECLQTTL